MSDIRFNVIETFEFDPQAVALHLLHTTPWWRPLRRRRLRREVIRLAAR